MSDVEKLIALLRSMGYPDQKILVVAAVLGNQEMRDVFKVIEGQGRRLS